MRQYRQLATLQKMEADQERFLIIHPDGQNCPQQRGCAVCQFQLSDEVKWYPKCTLCDRYKSLRFKHHRDTDDLVWFGNQPGGLFHCPAKRGYQMSLCLFNSKAGRWRAVLANAGHARVRLPSGEPVDTPYNVRPPPDDRWTLSQEEEDKVLTTFCDQYGKKTIGKHTPRCLDLDLDLLSQMCSLADVVHVREAFPLDSLQTSRTRKRTLSPMTVKQKQLQARKWSCICACLICCYV